MPEEMLDILDAQDNITGKCTRSEKIKLGAITRNAVVFIIDNDGKLLLSKRSLDKKFYPGKFDPAAVGNVMMGESYEDAAKRELQEELCVECRLQFVDKIFGDFSSDYPNLRYFTGVFLGRYSGKIKLNEELADAVRFSIADIEKLIKDKKEMFTPGFIREFHAIKEKLKK